MTGMLTRLASSASAVHLGLQSMIPCTRLTALHLLSAAEEVHVIENLHDLQQLVHLQQLHLEDFKSLPDNLLYNLPEIQVLKPTDGQDDTYDLSDATQLTALEVVQKDEWSLLRRLILPSGNSVQLQTFCLKCEGREAPEEQELSELVNLEAATGLQTLELDMYYPRSLHQAGWPQAMPSLTSLAASNMLFEPARKWQNYSARVKLRLTDMHSTSLPDWVAQLTGLRCLKLDNSFLQESPACILHLSQLEKLDLSGLLCPMMVPRAVTQLADWPLLTRLDFRPGGNRELTFDSQLHILHLQEALGHRQGVLQL